VAIPTSQMTPQQLKRHHAAVKAAATKKRNAAAAAGRPYAPPPPRPTPPPYTPPPPPPPTSGPSSPYTQPPTPPPTQPRPPAGAAFTPKPTAKTQRLVVIKALEDLFILVASESGITDERRHAFKKYQAVLARALSPGLDAHSQNEADNALRAAAAKLFNVCF
jgi:hypothetical protein